MRIVSPSIKPISTAKRSGAYTLVVLAGLMLVLPFALGNAYEIRVAAILWIMALGAVGLHLLMGLAGQISLGHAGFFGIGAYSVAILPSRFGWPIWVALLAGLMLSIVIAYLVGKPILRLRGHYLAIATLGFSLLVGLIITSETGWTGGPDGMPVETLVVAGHDISSPLAWYGIGASMVLVGTLIAMALRNSPTGRALSAILDSEVAAASMGIDVARRKLQVFIIAAVYAALAGSALALMNGFVTPDVAGFMMSVEFLAMVVIGGAATPLGAIVGAGLLTLLPQVLADFMDYQDIIIGLVIMLSMIFLQEGIVPALLRLVRRTAE